MTKEERAQQILAFLVEEGFGPRIDKDGDVTFKVEGRSYVIVIEEDDQEFFRLIFPNFWPIESEEERVRVSVAAAEANARTKVAKVYPVREDTWASVEMFLSPPEAFMPVFQRSIRALQGAVRAFVEAVRD